MSVAKFLKFFDSKRAMYVSEVDGIFGEFKESQLMEDMYSRDDVEVLLDQLCIDMKADIEKDQKTTARMAAVVVRQLLHAAEDAGVAIEYDVTKAEDERLVAEMARLRMEDDRKEAERSNKAVKLDSIRDEHAKLVAENERLKTENAQLRDRTASVMNQASSAQKARSSLAEEVEDLRAQVSRLKAGAAASEGKDASLEAEVASLKEQLAEARKSGGSGGKVSARDIANSKQFQQMRQMLTQKNQLLNEVRAKLRKYEPETGVDDADSDNGHK